MNTKLRNGELLTLQLRLQETLQLFIVNSHEGITRSCLNCQNFDESGLYGVREACTKATPPQRPPARIIAFGCPAHADNENIPF